LLITYSNYRFKVPWFTVSGFEILRGGTLRVTAAVHRFIKYVKQYEKCDPGACEIPLSVPLLAGNCEPDNLSFYYILNEIIVPVQVRFLWEVIIFN
jgi:hypothetical protein